MNAVSSSIHFDVVIIVDFVAKSFAVDAVMKLFQDIKLATQVMESWSFYCLHAFVVFFIQ